MVGLYEIEIVCVFGGMRYKRCKVCVIVPINGTSRVTGCHRLNGVPVTNLVDDLNEYEEVTPGRRETRAYLSNLDGRYDREYSVERACPIQSIEVDGG